MRELRLDSLMSGDTVQILAGEGEDTTELWFDVVSPGQTPTCEFRQRMPGDDDMVGPVRVSLVGCMRARQHLTNQPERVEGSLFLDGTVLLRDQRQLATSLAEPIELDLPISGLFTIKP